MKEPSPTSSKPLAGLLKRLVRKAIRWYVHPQIEYLEHQVDLATRLLEIEKVQVRLHDLESRVARLHEPLGRLRSRPYVNPACEQPPTDPSDSAEFDGMGFQDRFRGPSTRVRQLLAPYVALFTDRRAVVDLGCGRGEFLESLRQAGVPARGVEHHPRQAEECRAKGLVVVEADVLAYLESIPEGSVDGVFTAQMIEHIPFREVHRLFVLVLRKLAPDGVFVAETVNPHCLEALRLFHLDPTHVAPLYPETLQFVAESIGFRKVQIMYPCPRAEGGDPYFDCSEYAVVATR